MRVSVVLSALAIAVLLTGCNQSGRPRVQPATTAPTHFGEVVQGSYVVAPGDTLAIIAKRTNTPLRTLIDLNGLQPPYRLKGGERLALQPRIEYVVQPGDSVNLIALSQDVSPSALIQLNQLSAPYDLQVGQTLILPSDRDVPQSTAEPKPVASSGIASGALAPLTDTTSNAAGAPTPLEPAEPAQAKPTVGEPQPLGGTEASGPAQTVQSPTVATNTLPSLPATEGTQGQDGTETALIVPEPPPPPPPPPPPEPVAVEPTHPSSRSQFIWPVEGKIVSRFGSTSDGLRNDGINIAAPEGTPVKAAADGVVAYAGNELRGFGNMILIKHADNWVTAYAHNSSLLVKKGDTVKQGDMIARVGSTGNVANPQLHFEIRSGTKAVDPSEKLGN